jgi:hypothetical protein
MPVLGLEVGARCAYFPDDIRIRHIGIVLAGHEVVIPETGDDPFRTFPFHQEV